MTESIVSKILNFIKTHDGIPESEKDKLEVYKYGIELCVSSLINFLMILLVGILLRCFLASVVYYFVFVSLRVLIGGYHADTYIKCRIITASIAFIVLAFYKFVPLQLHLSVYLYATFIILLIPVILWAPFENENKPMSGQRKKLLKIISIFVLIIYFALISFLVSQNNVFSSLILYVVIVVDVMLIIPIIFRKE